MDMRFLVGVCLQDVGLLVFFVAGASEHIAIFEVE